MPSRPSRRSRIAAIAATADYNPEEAAVAQAMLERLPRDLEAIADDIKAEWGRGIESQFAIGRMLAEAWSIFEATERKAGVTRAEALASSTVAQYGRWLRDMDFPFSRATAYSLRIGYEREGEVRALLASRLASGGSDIGVTTAVTYMNRRPEPVTVPTAETTAVDPAFASLRDARTAILGWDGERTTHNAFEAMHVDDVRESAVILKALLDAYNEARSARG